MRVLILGAGGREHALSWKLSNEIGIENVFIASGNGGTNKCGKNVPISMIDFKEISAFCKRELIDVIIPGSEEPIALGIRDFIENEQNGSVFVLSPDKFAGQLESSKSFAKEFMMRHGIPTASYQTFTYSNLNEGYLFLEALSPPYVLKADGLAAGKGVLIIDNLEEAKKALKEMLEGSFGDASSSVVIEEFLDGIEYSVFVLTDGENYVILPEAKDYKRIGEGDTGLNTGGMGAVSPVPFYNSELEEITTREIIEPTIRGFKKDGYKYRGFVFFGLINVNGQPKVIEYNVRMGDPETEVVIPRMDESLSEIIEHITHNTLQTRKCKTKSEYCTTVFSVAGGYPEAYQKGDLIQIKEDSATLFHAGTVIKDGQLQTNGGRVLASTGFGDSLKSALDASYEMINGFDFKNRYFRKDIGKDLMKYEQNGGI